MKFAKYLQYAATPEWKNAHIDYRGLKKLINVVNIPQPSQVNSHADEHSLEGSRSLYELPPLSFSAINLSCEPPASQKVPYYEGPKSHTSPMQSLSCDIGLAHGLTLCSPLLEKDDPQRFIAPPAVFTHFSTPQGFAFFAMLDAQLDKVESFYLAREKEMIARSVLLLNQLKELQEQQKMFLEAGPKNESTFVSALLNTRIWLQKKAFKQKGGQVFNVAFPTPKDAGSIHSQQSIESLATDGNLFFKSALPMRKQKDLELQEEEEIGWTCHIEHAHVVLPVLPVSSNSKGGRSQLSISDDSDNYLCTAKKFKKAVLEHYRGLKMLNNYRLLNVVGFRKAVKKLEKKTKIPVENRYMAEKVGKCAFASGETVQNLIREIEEMYASLFVRGDRRKALQRLRAGTSPKSHYLSTFRSGLFIGLSIAAFISGLEKVFQPETQRAMPSWDILLFLYGMLFVPVLYSFLVGINLLIWAKSRINYVLIFGLDPSTRIDHRQYFEIPSLLLSSLCFAFWLSFSSTSTLQPTTLPLVWLTFAGFLMINPLHTMAKPSRYWLIKTISKLFLSGTRPVEFADFWLGDQLCSFVFVFANMPLFVCVYVDKFSEDWMKCKNSSRTWPIAFGLASIPFIIRLLQSVKRYFDTRVASHLINAGKYGTGIVSYLFYFMWGYQAHRGKTFALWCVFSTCYSIYGCTWDFLVDYSFLQPHSKHFLLRTHLLYPDHQWVYYVAMLVDIAIKFAWVIYIPKSGPDMMVRSFIAGMLEMLRRLTWNVYRLENEHTGKMNQCRVTREIPWPYLFDLEFREDVMTDDIFNLLPPKI